MVVDRYEEWPDTAGELKQRTLSFNAVGRGRLGRGVVVGEVSGGLSYFRMEGPISPLGYAAFTLGGHSMLSYELSDLEVEVGPASSWGFNAGGGIDVELGRWWPSRPTSVTSGGGAITAPVTVSRVLNEGEVDHAGPDSRRSRKRCSPRPSIETDARAVPGGLEGQILGAGDPRPLTLDSKPRYASLSPR